MLMRAAAAVTLRPFEAVGHTDDWLLEREFQDIYGTETRTPQLGRSVLVLL